jgi:hypothetical protein
MNTKNIAVGSISAGLVLLILMIVSGYLVNQILPGDISGYGGVRAIISFLLMAILFVQIWNI